MIKKPKSIRGKYIPGAAQAIFSEHLPDYVIPLLDFARLFGTRRGQLSRTHRTWIDRDRRALQWPPDECKNDEPHEIPIDEAGWAIIERLLADGDQRPWCPYLFHGRHCHPGRKPNKTYGCVGDFKKAWAKAMQAAGLPVGRKAGGYTFHNSRNTFATDFIAGGGSFDDAQQLGGWKTQHMVKHYNLGNREALRERLERARGEIERLRTVRA
jgi:integrase